MSFKISFISGVVLGFFLPILTATNVIIGRIDTGIFVFVWLLSSRDLMKKVDGVFLKLTVPFISVFMFLIAIWLGLLLG